MREIRIRAVLVVLCALFLLSSLLAGRSWATSLWSDGSLFADRTASAVGDLVLVKVVENVKDSDEGKVGSTKTTNENVESGFGILDIIRGFGIGSNSSLNSNTKVERTKKLTSTISCIVVDVLPNGNLVIEGDRFLTSGAEKMTVAFSGVIRRQDIGYNNTINSDRVAAAEIVVSGKGVVSRTQRPGIISQVLQAIF